MILSRRAAQLLLVVLSCVLVYGTWILPYRFPPRQFVIGASYEVGFSNAVSFFVYLICVPCLALVASTLLPMPSVETEASRRVLRVADRVALIVIAGHVLLFAALYAYKGRFVFAEGLYFQSLLYRMSTGEIPYRDFGFYYGPLMLYPAYWLTRLVSLDLAYGIWFITTYTVGLVFLYVLVRFILREDRARAFWFVLLALGLFNPLTGLNETFTRYLLPSIVFLAGADFMLRGGRGRLVAGSLLLAAAIAYSFEVAALSVAAILLLWCALGFGPALLAGLGALPANAGDPALPALPRLSGRAAILFAIGAGLAVIFFVLVDPSGEALRTYPAIAQAYSGGAHNVPIYPHLPFLALAGVSVVTLAALIRMALKGLTLVVALGCASYAALALMAQRAAFGAAEPSHFAYFGLPMFCLALFGSTQMPHSQASRGWLAAVLVVGIMLPMQYYHAMEFVPFFAHRLHLGVLPASTGPSAVAASGEDLEQNLRDVVRTVGANHPYVMYEMEYSSLPVYRDFGLRYATYYTMLITTRDSAGMRSAIEDIKRTGGVVVARAQDLHGLEPPTQSQGVTRVLDLLSGAHTAGSALNGLLMRSRSRLTEPFLAFIRDEYVPVYERHGLVAFAPRSSGTR